MQFSHFTFPVGGSACNGKCPFCVSRQTGNDVCPTAAPDVDWDRFQIACQIAMSSPGMNTALITGVGEPTLYRDQITTYLQSLQRYGKFPIVELQTNGLNLMADPDYLRIWKQLGLTTIALSVVHHEQHRNAEIYGGEHYDLWYLVKYLRGFGFTVRVCCMMMNDYIDNSTKIGQFISAAYAAETDQLTFRPIETPETSMDSEVTTWTEEHCPDKIVLGLIKKKLDKTAAKLLPFSWGAQLYGMPMPDGGEQNVCLSNCLTEPVDADEIRQLIFWPDGKIGYSWQHPAARIL